MNISPNLKKQILTEKNKLSVKQLSAKYKIPEKEIQKLIRKKSRKETPKWFYLVAILIPVLFIIVLEFSLRLIDYGKDYTQWITVNNQKYILNPNIAYKYFQNVSNIPISNQNSFDIIKKDNAFRVFILGGSSAAGYPYLPNGDFGRYIKKRLELLYPDNIIEVVNTAMTAINSYTIRDILPGILEQKPDLIIIYAGHNEYYGALGVGSMESLGKSRGIVNFVLYLSKFKTFELLKNAIQFVIKFFSSTNKKTGSGTLMARMAKDKLIPLNSEIYNSGLSQFEGNMNDVLEMTKHSKVPVILGTLVSNLKDQKPFVSIKNNNHPDAKDIFDKANEKLSKNNIKSADSLFRLAKDFDALRFRAPEGINEIIKKLGKKFNYPVLQADKLFDDASEDHITGNELTVDHLHPNLKGYHLLGRLFFNEMVKNNFLPKAKPLNIALKLQDSIAISKIKFSTLDSTIARYRVIILKNDWPFSKRKSKEYLMKQFNVKSYMDTLALKVIDGKLSWENAHREAAEWYIKNKNYKYYTYEINLLIDQYPFIIEYSDMAAKDLLGEKQYNEAYQFLHNSYLIQPDAFNTKWLGIIDLSRGNSKTAVNYLEKSTSYNNSDPQVFFNLAGAYIKEKKFDFALNRINACLRINPKFPEAKALREQLTRLVK